MKTMLTLLLLVLSSQFVVAEETLFKVTQKAKLELGKENQQREKEFALQEDELKQQRTQLKKKLKALEEEVNKLSDAFQKNEDEISGKTEQLTLATGSLGELFGSVRQHGKEIQSKQKGSLLSVGNTEQLELINDLVMAKELPSTQKLVDLWRVMTQELSSSTRRTQLTLDHVGVNGVITKKEAVRLGSIALVDSNGYLIWNSQYQQARAIPKQPTNSLNSDSKLTNNQFYSVDPSQGEILMRLDEAPTIWERVEQGGVIGKVILVLLLVGIGIGLVQGTKLFIVNRQVKRQLRNLDVLGDNPLGRVLGSYDTEKHQNVEALELRLLEAVMHEQQSLERGLSMLKLLAAIAPMLGLLGTVTGMIETFQVITQFGNSDPKIMAGGISVALITTVMGLVSAMPLLFIHNILTTQSENIRNIIEKQGVGIVAAQAELQMVGVK